MTTWVESGQTERVIDPRFVFLAALMSLTGAIGYIRATLRGDTSPNRVTWSIWALEGILGFIVEVQQHVGLAALMTLMLGLVPLVVVAASFRNPHSVWKIGLFDGFCGVISLLGLVFWALVNEPTIALVSFVAADQVAALPTIRKSWLAPATESPWAFFTGVLSTGVTLLTLQHFTTAGALFPGCVLVADLIIALLVVTRVGPRVRHDVTPSSAPSVA
jgi:hypothetical protein